MTLCLPRWKLLRQTDMIGRMSDADAVLTPKDVAKAHHAESLELGLLPRIENDLNKLLLCTYKYPARFRISVTPSKEEAIALSILRVKVEKTWIVKDVVTPVNPDAPNVIPSRFWELTPKDEKAETKQPGDEF